MQKKNYFTKLLLALFALLPMTVAAQESVKLAEWNMENSADIAVTWFKDGAPQIAPDEAIGDKANYLLTGWSEGRYWQLCTGYQNKVLRIENATENAITDYTDASKHNVYYEVQFPTTGYKNISVDFACAYGANAEATLEAVVSTDGAVPIPRCLIGGSIRTTLYSSQPTTKTRSFCDSSQATASSRTGTWTM